MFRIERAFGVPKHGFRLPRGLKKTLASLAIAALVGMTALAGIGPQVASAALAASGPVDPANGFPMWYQDANGVQLQLCINPNDPLCAGLAAPPNPALPVSFPANFPDESFYYMVSADITAGAVTAFWEGALEATFVNGLPAAGEQIVFGRIRIRMDGLTPNASYTVTHPYGQKAVVADVRGAVRDTVDIGLVPGLFSGPLSATTSAIGPFLRQVTPAPPAGALGDGVSLATVTGSPTRTNFFRVAGPNVGGPGLNQIQTNFFTVMGRLVPPPPPVVTATVPGLYQQNAPSLRYLGAGWTTFPWAGASGGTFSASLNPGDTAEIRFTGTGVRWHTIAAFNRGSAQVFVDGVLRSTVNNNAPGVATKIVDILGLAAGTHTVRIQVVGGGYVDVDALQVQ